VATVDLRAWAQARDQARVEAVLAEINAALPRSPCAAARNERALNVLVYQWPSPERVAALRESHGVYAVRERWGWVSEDELESLAARGREARS